MKNSGEYVTLNVKDGTEMRAYVARPSSGDGPFPGLLIFQEAFGVNSHIRDLAHRFAAEGYVCIAPELFHRTAPGFEGDYNNFPAIAPHMQALTEEGLLADAVAAYEWLIAQSDVRTGAIAGTGYCMGGRIAFLANTALPLKAAVSYYGGRIVPDLVKKTAQLHAPMLFFWGGLDKHIPAEHVQEVVAALKKEGRPHVSVEISYADHGFFNDQRTAYHPQAAKEAWALTLAFLKNKLA
ncbi:MAG TPA: dienelactone hydrolase family protein [Bacteroidia bacterium]|nr:dienelactone hydrolase family protein [Bacteroidia bacterium]